jgi:tellurite resistance-related uncharacterized protein
MTKNLPDDVRKYSETPVFNEQTVPDNLTSEHNLKAGVWGKLCVIAGHLDYHVPGAPDQKHAIETGEHVVIEPRQVHFVRPIGDVRFKVEFYR